MKVFVSILLLYFCTVACIEVPSFLKVGDLGPSAGTGAGEESLVDLGEESLVDLGEESPVDLGPSAGRDEGTSGGVNPDDGGIEPPVESAPCIDTPSGCPEIEWISIEGGSFMMGTDEYSDTTPIHMVTIPPFSVMKSEVTVGMYRKCVDARGCQGLTSTYDGCNWSDDPMGFESKPLACTRWHDAKSFADWVGARLLSESEWEYLATNKGETNYAWGDMESRCGTRSADPLCYESPIILDDVCSHPAGNTQDGLCDLSGGVIEWVLDEYSDSYNGAPNDGRSRCDINGCSGAESIEHVIRGGNGSVRDSRYRYTCNNGNPCNYVGFRLAR